MEHSSPQSRQSIYSKVNNYSKSGKNLIETDFHLRIYASNINGASQPLLIPVPTLKESSRFLILPPDESEFPFFFTLSVDILHY